MSRKTVWYTLLKHTEGDSYEREKTYSAHCPCPDFVRRGHFVPVSQRFFPGGFRAGAAGLYQPLCTIFPFVLFPASVSLCGAGPHPKQYQRRCGRDAVRNLVCLFLTYAAVVSGSLLVFWLARTLGRDFADRVVSRRVSEKYQEIIRSKTSVFLILAFLFPFFPDDVLCILAGLTSISFRRFALIVLLARPWGLLFASALGGDTHSVPLGAMIPIGLTGAVLFLLGLRYADRLEQAVLRRLRRRRKTSAME